MSIFTYLILALAATVIISALVWDYVGLWGPTIITGAFFMLYTFVAATHTMGIDDDKVNPAYTHMAWAGLVMLFVAMTLALVSKRISTPAHIRAQER